MDRMLDDLLWVVLDNREPESMHFAIPMLISLIGIIIALPMIYFLDSQRSKAKDSAINSSIVVFQSTGVILMAIGLHLFVINIFGSLGNRGPDGPSIFAFIGSGFVITSLVHFLQKSKSLNVSSNTKQMAAGLNLVIFSAIFAYALKPVILVSSPLLIRGIFTGFDDYRGYRDTDTIYESLLALLIFAIATAVSGFWYKRLRDCGEDMSDDEEHVIDMNEIALASDE